jgi:hypothetical protein
MLSPATSCHLLLLASGPLSNPRNLARNEPWRARSQAYRCLLDSKTAKIRVAISMRYVFPTRLGKHQGSARGAKIVLNCLVKSTACGRLTSPGGCRFFLVRTRV